MKNDGAGVLLDHEVVSHEAWVAARKAFLAKEKELTRLRDEVNEARRALPWERVDTEYLFDGPDGRQTLAALFDGRSQLVVYHAMFNPEKATDRTPWTADAACKVCSFWLDNLAGIVTHVAHRDVTLIAASRAPVAKIAAYQKRMGWTFKWVSAGDPFNFDYGVSFSDDAIARQDTEYNYVRQPMRMSEFPGISVFYKDPSGAVFHTYSTYGRGLDMLNVGYHYLDLVPKGRDEGEGGNAVSWLQRHDEYGPAKAAACH
jgi:predicted dithiol-disulfide oxidoreductase (DUF899 family)